MQFQFKYYKDPGVIMDAIKVLSLKLNSKSFLPSVSILITHNSQELEHLKEQLNSFLAPPKELLLFCYKPQENSCNFLTSYIEKILCRSFTHTTLSSVCKKLESISSLKHELFSFYLQNEYSPGCNLASILRTNTALPDHIKFYLLSFQLDPSSFSSLLITWIRKYAAEIEQNFLSDYASFQPNVQSLQILIEHTHPEQKNSFFTRPLHYSVCSVLRDFQYIHWSPNCNWLITGYRFQDVVKAISQRSYSFDLEDICEALGDPIRMKMINYLYQHKNSTRQQMIDAIAIPTSSYHHLEKLKKVDLIVSHRQNNNQIYSLNYSVFEELATIFNSYAKGGSTLTNGFWGR